MDDNFLIKFDSTTGERLETYPLDNTISEERKQEMLAEGFEIVPRQDWELLVGNVDGKEYVKDIEHGGYKEKPPYVPTLQEAQESKIAELKKARDEEEITPVPYNGNLFDFDTKSFDRINAAIIALDGGGSIGWTTATNTVVQVTANDLRGVIAAAAVRSNALHEKYRTLKERVMAAQTVAEVENVHW